MNGLSSVPTRAIDVTRLGAGLLDLEVPKWYSRIDTLTLRPQDNERSVLGQLFSLPRRGPAWMCYGYSTPQEMVGAGYPPERVATQLQVTHFAAGLLVLGLRTGRECVEYGFLVREGGGYTYDHLLETWRGEILLRAG